MFYNYSASIPSQEKAPLTTELLDFFHKSVLKLGKNTHPQLCLENRKKHLSKEYVLKLDFSKFSAGYIFHMDLG